MLKVAGGFLRAEKDTLKSERGMEYTTYEAGLLMRALRDFNLPKIVADDMVVFLGLIKARDLARYPCGSPSWATPSECTLSHPSPSVARPPSSSGPLS